MLRLIILGDKLPSPPNRAMNNSAIPHAMRCRVVLRTTREVQKPEQCESHATHRNARNLGCIMFRKMVMMECGAVEKFIYYIAVGKLVSAQERLIIRLIENLISCQCYMSE